ncbi:MAG: DUF4421 family protein [Bdellovibrionales bacterium]|nr:DUF4421 family protein [Bdellovibrionales bacterium]
MGKTLAVLVLCLLSLSQAQAQEENLPFEELKSPWLAQAVLEFPFYSFYLGAPAVKGVAYLPNFAPRLGPRVIYRDVGATLTFSLPIPDNERTRRGDSKAQSLIINSYWRQFAFDLYYQRYKSFYVASPWTEVSVNKPARYAQLPDAQVLNYGLNAYLILRPERYSLKAAFDQTEIQSQSGGSWLVAPFYNHLEMFLGGKFVPGSDTSSFRVPPNLASSRFDTLGAGFGYGYTYVKRRYFLNGQVAYGPGFQSQRLQREDGDNSAVYSLAAKLNVNASTGWNYPEYVGGAKLLVDSVWARVQDTQVTSTLVSLQFFFGRRF